MVFHPKALRTILVLVIAIAIAVGIMAAVYVIGEQYRQELFEEYMEDSQKSSNPSAETIHNQPRFDILP